VEASWELLRLRIPFIEADPENHKFLNNNLKIFKDTVSPWPLNVNTLVSRCRFQDTVMNGINEHILQFAGSDGVGQATFLFVAPFGYTGMSMALLTQLYKSRAGHTVELFLNFMTDYIHRAAFEESQENNMMKHFDEDINQWRKKAVYKVDPEATKELCRKSKPAENPMERLSRLQRSETWWVTETPILRSEGVEELKNLEQSGCN
jgi:hypothetical protein